MIQAIVFDYAGVIGSGALMGWVKEHNTDENQLLKRFREKSDMWDLGKVTEAEFITLIAKITGVLPEHVWDTLYEPAECDPEVIDLILSLKSQYKIALFSDNFAPLLRKLLDYKGLTKNFDEIIISSDYHLKKPDPKFFEVLLRTLNLNADEVVFTDDTEGNVDGAIKFGINAIHFQSASQLREELKKFGVSI